MVKMKLRMGRKRVSSASVLLTLGGLLLLLLTADSSYTTPVVANAEETQLSWPTLRHKMVDFQATQAQHWDLRTERHLSMTLRLLERELWHSNPPLQNPDSRLKENGNSKSVENRRILKPAPAAKRPPPPVTPRFTTPQTPPPVSRK